MSKYKYKKTSDHNTMLPTHDHKNKESCRNLGLNRLKAEGYSPSEIKEFQKIVKSGKGELSNLPCKCNDKHVCEICRMENLRVKYAWYNNGQGVVKQGVTNE